MPSAQVAVTAPSRNVCEREGRPSALGHFLSKFGSAKTRSKSPTITLSLKCKTNTSPPKGSTHTDLAKEDFHNAEGTPHCGVRFSQKTTLINNESNISDVDRSRTPPPKPKRTSSPFARVLNRLSMSRKHFNSASNEHIHEISPETLCSKAPLTITASPSCIATSPRPAISENDLRHITLHRGQWSQITVNKLARQAFINNVRDDAIHMWPLMRANLQPLCSRILARKFPIIVVESRFRGIAHRL
uniref:Uncharacterized protein n=1 Tax=Ascaris lumbricoides TaxID=6252 RepID=A0A9J2P0R5_ASCLU